MPSVTDLNYVIMRGNGYTLIRRQKTEGGSQMRSFRGESDRVRHRYTVIKSCAHTILNDSVDCARFIAK